MLGFPRMVVRACSVFVTLAISVPMFAQKSDSDLSVMSLEDLMKVEVTSVSRRQEEIRVAAAAVYVITQEDIRNSGATNIPDLLRLVPGLSVSQINASTWAVSARGFGEEYANKLLVMIDGRTLYDSFFSGVRWRLQNVVLEDIDRIEVIRGPGATMWGANAVNGVISITTKKASETQGGLLAADAGSTRPGEGSLRFGGKIGKNAFYRIYGNQATRSSFDSPDGSNATDSWNMTTAGTRLDWKLNESTSLKFDASAYRGISDSRETITTSLFPVTVERLGLRRETGGHILGEWNQKFRNSDLKFHFYYDQRENNSYDAQQARIIDFDLQHSFKIGGRHAITWGLGHRETNDEVYATSQFSVNPPKLRSYLTSAFAQDEIAVTPKVLLTIGSKFENSSFTGNDLQPAIHLSWAPTQRHSAWISASRAVRTASRIERGMTVTVATFPAGQLTGLVNLYGQPTTRSEGLIAYEAGYRYQARRKLWLDAATFYNAYDHLSTTEMEPSYFDPQPVPHIVAPLVFRNGGKAGAYGTELAARYRATNAWTITGGYTFLHVDLSTYNKSALISPAEDESPRRQIHLGSQLSLPASFELGSHAYFVGALRNGIQPYTRLDANLVWKHFEHTELSVVAQNLLGAHQEAQGQSTPPSMIGRSIFGKITWRF